METRSRKRRDSDADSIASACSEPAITRSRSTTPFTLRSHCTRHGSECPEGHGINFRNRLSPSPKGSSSKKSPKKITIGRNGSIRKNIALNLEAQYQKDQHATLTASAAKPVSQTSDYSSGEEDKAQKSELCATPPQNTLQTTPLKRSTEKTDYTYAKSYSYRTEVTPERVICMPNMTRRSIERVHGDAYSSPELRFTSSKPLFNSVGKTPGINTSYKNGYDSDQEYDDNEPYKLKTPSNSCSSTASFLKRFTLSKLKRMMFSFTWWIYLITCYSLLLDTVVLQSRGITKLRNFCRQQTKSSRNLLLMLFLFLPLCLLAGGLLYSALHAFSTRATDKPTNTFVNPPTPQDFTPSVSPVVTPFTDSDQPPNDSAWQDIKSDLKATKDALVALQQKINHYDGKVSNLASQVDLFQGQIIAVQTESKSRSDQTTPDLLERIVEAKLGAMISQFSKQTGLTLENFGATIIRFNEALSELKEFRNWKQILGQQNDKLADELSQMQKNLDEKELSVLRKIATEIEKAIKRWEADSKPMLINDIKDQLLVEIRQQIKMLNTNKVGGLNKDEVEQMIQSALGVYDSDKTGLADYALEPAGGVVLSTRCTETFSSHRPRLSIWGFSLWSEPNNPRVVIQPGIVPGQCWSFRGFDGYLVIQLSRRIVPTAFTLEHIPKRLAPDGQIDSAPRNFTVYGLTKEADIAGVKLGQYTYDSLGEPLQTFQVQAHDSGAFTIVELRIHSNHGNLNYTCLYRFRVHGKIA